MTASDAAIFLPFATAIGIWVAWSDMKTMKIPNKAVLSLGAVWLVLGAILLPWPVWGWAIAMGAAALFIGFFATAMGLFGAGDAKFIAVMVPFFVQGNLNFILLISSAVMISALVAHRAWRAIPALRAMAPDWQSFDRKDFPMGLALAGILMIYLAQKAFS
jgi:prepilin peptidase CpaA